MINICFPCSLQVMPTLSKSKNRVSNFLPSYGNMPKKFMQMYSTYGYLRIWILGEQYLWYKLAAKIKLNQKNE